MKECNVKIAQGKEKQPKKKSTVKKAKQETGQK